MLLDMRGELVADFQQYYGLNLADLLAAYDYERIEYLALNLPIKARTVAKLNPEAAWDENAYLLSYIADNIAFQRYEQAGGKGKKPKPIERPKAKEKPAEKKHLNMSKRKVDNLLFAPRKKVGE